MKIKLLLFGILSDTAGSNEIVFNDVKTSDELNQLLLEKYPGLNKVTYRIAVNMEMITENTVLKDGDEVAMLPPFAGG
jgi:molybdopterin converting factor small subunit